MNKVIVSACLVGHSCRWHGKKCYVSSYVKKYMKNNPNSCLIPVCPELAAGLGVPRPPVKRRGLRIWETCADKKKRREVTGKELTKEFKEGAEIVYKKVLEKGIKEAILCKWSPSCGKDGVLGKLLQSKGVKTVHTF